MDSNEIGAGDTAAFVFEGEIDVLVTEAIEKHLKDKQYDEAQVSNWINYICEDVTYSLVLLGKPFKYAVNCVIMQTTGAGMHSQVSEYVDGFNDGVGAVKWPKTDGKGKDETNITCVVTVFGFAIYTSTGS